jgi:ABC-2 type transport system permease protein
MNLSAIYTVWLREMLRYRKDTTRVIGGLVTPILYLVILGIGLGSAYGLDQNGSFLGYIGPGIIGMSLLFTSIFTGISVIFEKQFGFLKEMLVSPISRGSIALGKIAGSATIATISGVLLLILMLVFGVLPFSVGLIPSYLLAILVMGLISSVFCSIGLSLAAKMDSMEGFQFVMSFLVMPVFLLSGVFFPLDKTPDWMRLLSHADPLMYGVDSLRGLLLGHSMFPLEVSLGVLLGFALFSGYITVRVFRGIKV